MSILENGADNGEGVQIGIRTDEEFSEIAWHRFLEAVVDNNTLKAKAAVEEIEQHFLGTNHFPKALVGATGDLERFLLNLRCMLNDPEGG